MPARPISGAQYTLAAGRYAAEIASVGASVRTLRFRGRDLVLPYRADEIRPDFRGSVLAPWANRIARGAWRWKGTDLQLPITEPERGHALHGLVAWADWQPVEHADDAVTLTTEIVAQPGYPFALSLTVTCAVDDDGLRCELRAVNDGTEAAPFGCSSHPYLVAPTGELDSWTMHVGADSQLLVDETLIPVERVPVRPEHDFRIPRPIGDAQIDHAFTGFQFRSGTESVTLTDARGDGARIMFGRDLPWLQVCTSDWPGRPGHRAGVAIEPMTSPPNAFVTNEDVIQILPGADHRTSWRIEAVAARAA